MGRSYSFGKSPPAVRSNRPNLVDLTPLPSGGRRAMVALERSAGCERRGPQAYALQMSGVVKISDAETERTR
jgi:hypothetical protein